MNQLWVHMCYPSRTPLSPPSPFHPPGSSQCTSCEHPLSCIEPGLAIHFTYDNIQVSTLFSQTIPLSPCSTESKIPHRPASERFSCCLETSPLSRLPPWDRASSLSLLPLFLSFIFCPTYFWRQWAVFLGAWCPLPASRSCFVEFAQHSNDLSMNLWGRKWSPHPSPLPS